VKFDKDGHVVSPDGSVLASGEPYAPLEQVDVWPQTKVTKEEFISGMLNNPLLGESLRRLGSCDHVLHAKKSIPLDVTIMDPHHQEEEDQINDVLDVQQTILFEVWDTDAMNKDFLGEAWLPPLNTFGKRGKDIVLPLQKVNYSEDADNGPSREDPKKEIIDDGKDPNKKITGELFVSVSWDYPVFKDLALYTDLKAWLSEDVKIEDKVVPDGQPNMWAGRTRTDAIKERYVDLKSLAEEMVDTDGQLKQAFFQEFPNKHWDKTEIAALNKFFREHVDVREDVRDRAAIQEKLHSGTLTMKITEARWLRRADAKKFRDCDPAVTVWIRNDHQMAWRKKPLFRTKTISNDRNPKWDITFRKQIATGSYEARYKLPEEGWMAEVKKAVRSRKQNRYLEEDRTMAMVKRFGKEGLKVKFADNSGAHSSAYTQAQGSLGDNHRVEVLIGDNIREFKAKLTAACHKEKEFWKGRNDEYAARYADIKIGFRHLVMVFVPSVKVQKLYAQKLHEGEEYKRAYKQAMEDPSNWQPLDPSRSFAQYTQFSFGRSQQPTLLRVVEASEAYKAQNLRYKLYDEEMNKRIWQDTNERAKCAGWARYQHEADDSSIEWRPAFISRAHEEGSKHFEAKWVFEPSKLVLDKKNNKPNAPLVEEEPSRQMKERLHVLLGPRIPKFEDEVHEEHEDLLAQAKMLRSSGKSDWDIEAILNKLLTDRWEEKKRNGTAAERPPPPPITVDVIRLYLQRKEAQEVEKADKHTNANKAAMMSGSNKSGGPGI